MSIKKAIENKQSNVTMDVELNCDQCDFQTNLAKALNKHINMKHGKHDQSEDVVKCFNCEDQFSDHWSLMNHRREKHHSYAKPCSSYKEGNCKFADTVCWWRHEDVDTNRQPLRCQVCDQTFNTKNEAQEK